MRGAGDSPGESQPAVVEYEWLFPSAILLLDHGFDWRTEDPLLFALALIELLSECEEPRAGRCQTCCGPIAQVGRWTRFAHSASFILHSCEIAEPRELIVLACCLDDIALCPRLCNAFLSITDGGVELGERGASTRGDSHGGAWQIVIDDCTLRVQTELEPFLEALGQAPLKDPDPFMTARAWKDRTR
jgi:hypothetical protein